METFIDTSLRVCVCGFPLMGFDENLCHIRPFLITRVIVESDGSVMLFRCAHQHGSLRVLSLLLLPSPSLALSYLAQQQQHRQSARLWFKAFQAEADG
jgi:hypothetical protein